MPVPGHPPVDAFLYYYDSNNVPVPVSTSNGMLMGGQYNTVLPVILNGKSAPLQTDSSGRLIISPSFTLSGQIEPDTYMVNAVAVPSSTKLFPIGMIYNAVAPTYADGQATMFQADINGYQKTREQYIPSYEDNTNNVAAMMQKPVISSIYSDQNPYAVFGTVTNANIRSVIAQVYAFELTSLETSSLFYFQLFNKASAPALNDVPIYSVPITVAADSTHPTTLRQGREFFGQHGRNVSLGLSWGISSTKAAYAAAGTAANYQVHISVS